MNGAGLELLARLDQRLGFLLRGHRRRLRFARPVARLPHVLFLIPGLHHFLPLSDPLPPVLRAAAVPVTRPGRLLRAAFTPWLFHVFLRFVLTKFPPAVRDLAGRLVAGAAASGASSPVDRQSVASVALRAPPVLRVDFAAAAAAATAAFLASARSRPVVGLATGG